MNGKTVLIVDGDSTLAQAAALLLEGKGLRVHCARRVREVAAALGRGMPDVAVVARTLPDGDGGFVRDLLAAAGAVVPVVDIIDAEVLDRESGLAGPTSATLVRPVAPEELAETVERLANGASVESFRPRDRDRPACRGLIIDDEPDHCAMIEECFSGEGRERVEMVWAHSVDEACRMLADTTFDFVLLDHNLPDGTGCDVLERMEEQLLTTPVIGLSTSGDPRVALADFRGGALEFIQKHEAFEGHRLRQRVFEVIANHKRRIMANVMERRRRKYGIDQSDDELIAAARTDAMLQIFNRAAFEDVHRDLHARCVAEERAYGLCLVDVDCFKRFNDHYGHAAGDEALRQVAKALSLAVRPEDFVARYGGEELVVLLDLLAADVIAVAAERLCASVRELDLPHAAAPAGRVTASVGAAVFAPASGESAAQMIERTDAALYEAKSRGRDCAVTAPPAGDALHAA